MPRWCLACLLPLLATGCSFLLPRSQERVESGWRTFAEAKASFDRIEERRTRRGELEGLGFPRADAANVRSLNYLELVRALVPIGPLTNDDLPDPLRECISARDACRGLEVDATSRRRERLGFWLLDLLAFRRQVRTRGWDFWTTVVLVDDVVVYKTWRGTPEIDEYADEIRPLGPLQEPVGFLMGLFVPG